MGKVFRSISMVAGLSGLPAAAHALQIVDWGESAPHAGAPAPFPQGMASWTARASGAARQHVPQYVGGPMLASLVRTPEDSSWEPPDASPSQANWTVPGPPPASEEAWETEGSSPLLAGLGAAALLMWRRLRRG